MKSFKDLAKSLENLPWIVRLILVIIYDLLGNITRLCKSIGNKNILGIILAIILIISAGAVIFWIIDLVCVILNKKLWWID